MLHWCKIYTIDCLISLYVVLSFFWYIAVNSMIKKTQQNKNNEQLCICLSHWDSHKRWFIRRKAFIQFVSKNSYVIVIFLNEICAKMFVCFVFNFGGKYCFMRMWQILAPFTKTSLVHQNCSSLFLTIWKLVLLYANSVGVEVGKFLSTNNCHL